MRKRIEWGLDKNEWLKANRGVCFEDVEAAVQQGDVLGIEPHPNKEKYPDQSRMIVRIRGYVYIVPFVINTEGRIFLKTIFANRKYVRKYLP